MVTYFDEESTGQGADVAVTPGSEAATTVPRLRAKWLVVGVLAVVLVAGSLAGVAVAHRTRDVASADPATSSVAALQHWWAGAEKDFTDMRSASRDVDQAFSRFRPGALTAACQHVHDAAAVMMESGLPSPNRKLTAELDGAIKDFNFASHLCLAGVAGSPADYDGEFLSVMAQANKHMQAAQDIIDQILIDA